LPIPAARNREIHQMTKTQQECAPSFPNSSHNLWNSFSFHLFQVGQKAK
jgi:hypothetical protein